MTKTVCLFFFYKEIPICIQCNTIRFIPWTFIMEVRSKLKRSAMLCLLWCLRCLDIPYIGYAITWPSFDGVLKMLTF